MTCAPRCSRQQRDFAADAAAAADDQNDLAAQFLFRRLAANLRFFQLPSIQFEMPRTAAAPRSSHER